FLEKTKRLNRGLEFLPTDEEIAKRRAAKLGLTHPERAVLLAYSKIWLYDQLIESQLPDDPWVATALERYFPPLLRERFAAYMPKHPLRREIIATHVVNSMVNRVGSTFVHNLTETTGAKAAEVVRAYLLQREVFGYVALWQAIEALDGKVADSVQSEMLIEASRLTVRLTTWFLRSKRLTEDTAATIAYFGAGVQAIAANLPALLDDDMKRELDARTAHYTAEGVPKEVAARVASSEILFSALDIVELSSAHGKPVETVARVYFDLAASLGLPWLRGRIGQLAAEGHWPSLAKNAMRDDLAGLQRALTSEVLTQANSDATPDALIALWQSANRLALERTRHMLGELRNNPAPDLAMLSVALRELRNLA
ncbi:MAG: glutamate dehydrogenase, partial [Betaproteobacteria bacterium]